MKQLRSTIYGFICFFLTSFFVVSLMLIVYSFVQYEKMWIRLLAILGVVLFSSVLFTFIDYIRRKTMIHGPITEIVDFTHNLSKGKFTTIRIEHSREEYDEFDIIKENLNLMSKELLKNQVLKNDFIGNISHEIKTPISVIQNYAKILEDSNLSIEERTRYLKNLQDASNKLSKLVKNILKLNKLENQNTLIEFEKFNLSESLSNQIVSYIDLIENKNIELILDIEEDLYITSEESYLNIIWNNLIGNAVKFTNNEGTIKISLRKEKNNYIFTIKDSGCGMSTETGRHIFDKFYQGDTSHSKEGNGLGLALVKQVIDVLGGSIKVESELGVGTTFIVTIKED